MPQVRNKVFFYETIHTFLSQIKARLDYALIIKAFISSRLTVVYQTATPPYWLLSFNSTLLFNASSDAVLP